MQPLISIVEISSNIMKSYDANLSEQLKDVTHTLESIVNEDKTLSNLKGRVKTLKQLMGEA